MWPPCDRFPLAAGNCQLLVAWENELFPTPPNVSPTGMSVPGDVWMGRRDERVRNELAELPP